MQDYPDSSDLSEVELTITKDSDDEYDPYRNIPLAPEEGYGDDEEDSEEEEEDEEEEEEFVNTIKTMATLNIKQIPAPLNITELVNDTPTPSSPRVMRQSNDTNKILLDLSNKMDTIINSLNVLISRPPCAMDSATLLEIARCFSTTQIYENVKESETSASSVIKDAFNNF